MKTCVIVFIYHLIYRISGNPYNRIDYSNLDFKSFEILCFLDLSQSKHLCVNTLFLGCIRFVSKTLTKVDILSVAERLLTHHEKEDQN